MSLEGGAAKQPGPSSGAARPMSAPAANGVAARAAVRAEPAEGGLACAWPQPGQITTSHSFTPHTGQAWLVSCIM